MFAATQQIASVAGLKATKVQVCVLPLVLSFFLMIPISSSECSSHRARFWWCEFSSVSNILQKRIDVCDDARERSDLRCALLVSPREWTKTNARNNASSRRCVVRSLEVDPQRIDFWDLTTLWEENILVRERRRERKKSSIFDLILSRTSGS